MNDLEQSKKFTQNNLVKMFLMWRKKSPRLNLTMNEMYGYQIVPDFVNDSLSEVQDKISEMEDKPPRNSI